MKKITICCAGSFQNKKSGFAAAIYYEDLIREIDVIYSNSSCNTSHIAELQAVISGLEYVQQKFNLIDSDITIEVKTDAITIVEFMENRKFEEWDKVSWRRGNKPIHAEVRERYKLSYICKEIGIERIKFIKTDNKSDKVHKMSHHYAKQALSLNLFKKEHYNLLKSANLHDYKKNHYKAENIVIQETKLDRTKSQMPWTKNQIRKQEKLKINWLEYIKEESIEDIAIKDIILAEDVHLKAQEVNLNGKLAKYLKTRTIDRPILVRRIESNKYILVLGITRFIAAKVLDFDSIPGILTELNYEEIINKFKDKE